MSVRDPQEEQLLIDYALGRCDEQTAGVVRERLGRDGDFARLHQDISNTFAALGRLPAPEAPVNLAERTLSRVRAARKTEALLAARPTVGAARARAFSYRGLAALAAGVLLAAGIMTPLLRHERRLRDRDLCAQHQALIGAALGQYAQDNGGVLPAGPALVEAWMGQDGTVQASNSTGLFTLVRKGVPAEVFQCPSAGAARPVAVTAAMTDFTPKGIGYSYQHSFDGPVVLDKLRHVAMEMAVLADANPVFPCGRFCPDRLGCQVSENHADGGQNVLYLDGHVAWTTHGRVGVNGDNIWLAEGVLFYTGREHPTSPTDSFLLPNRGQ